MHWGYVWNAPVGVAMTSIPTLGLVHIDSSQQAAATQAMFYDNITYFTEHNMLHALTSPMGTMQWTLATSPYWGVAAESDGATLWRLLTPMAMHNNTCSTGLRRRIARPASHGWTRGAITNSGTRWGWAKTGPSCQKVRKATLWSLQRAP